MASQRPRIKGSLSKLSNDNLITLAQAASAGLAAAVGVFATPAPTLIQLDADILAFSGAVTTWGAVGNRGSHADHVAMLTARATLVADLRALIAYCENTVVAANPLDYIAQRDNLTLTGFPLRSNPSVIGPFGPPQNLRQLIQRRLQNSNQAYIRWKKPLGTSWAKPNAYKVFRVSGWTTDPTLVFVDANVVGVTSDTRWLDSSVATGDKVTYGVQAIGATGAGQNPASANSDPVMAIGQ